MILYLETLISMNCQENSSRLHRAKWKETFIALCKKGKSILLMLCEMCFLQGYHICCLGFECMPKLRPFLVIMKAIRIQSKEWQHEYYSNIHHWSYLEAWSFSRLLSLHLEGKSSSSITHHSASSPFIFWTVFCPCCSPLASSQDGTL